MARGGVARGSSIGVADGSAVAVGLAGGVAVATAAVGLPDVDDGLAAGGPATPQPTSTSIASCALTIPRTETPPLIWVTRRNRGYSPR
jgi:hypothetical protein